VWKNKSNVQLAALVQEVYRNTPNDQRPKEVWVDAIGNGGGVYDILKAPGSELRDVVRECNVAQAPWASETDLRLRDELWFMARAWFDGENVAFPRNLPPEEAKLLEELIAELTTPCFDFTATGKRVVESKDEYKKRLGRSSDLADAFIMTMYAGVHSRPPRGDRPWDRDDESVEDGLAAAWAA
jgi:hypothetical protein